MPAASELPPAELPRLGWARAATLAAGTGLAVGALDARAGWLTARSAPPEQVAWSLALATVLVAAAWLAAWVLTIPLRRGGPRDGPAALAVSVTLLTAWSGLASLRARDAWPSALDLALVAVPALALGGAVVAVGRGVRPGPRAAWRAHLCAFALLAVVGPTWLLTFEAPASAQGALAALVALAALGTVAAATAAGRRLLARGGPALVWLALALVLAAPWLTRSPRPPVRPAASVSGPRTVVLIVLDTLRADALSYLAGGPNRTPHIDGLAAESAVFEVARVPSSWTLPSTVTILSGQPPRAHGVVDARHALPASMPTIAERLSEAGYRTAAFGENGWLTPRTGLARGFDEYALHPQRLANAPIGGPLVRRVLPGRFRAALPGRALTDDALAWLSDQGGEAAFLWLHYFDAHQPYAPPRAFRPPGEPAPGVGAAFDDFDGVRRGYFAPDRRQRDWIRALYLAEVRALDAEVGRLLDGLRALGRFDDALVVLTSDHGEELWEHGGFEHGHTQYEELLRVPLLVRRPGGRDAGRVARPVSVEAIAPTVLALCGLGDGGAPLPRPPLFEPDPEPLVATDNLYFAPQAALVDGRWKYVRDEREGAEQLFDLGSDPGETRSVAESEPGRTAALRGLLDERLARWAAESPKGETVDPDAGTLGALRELGYVR